MPSYYISDKMNINDYDCEEVELNILLNKKIIFIDTSTCNYWYIKDENGQLYAIEADAEYIGYPGSIPFLNCYKLTLKENVHGS